MTLRPRLRHLVNDILPTLRSAPGFVSGYLAGAGDGNGSRWSYFETEDNHAMQLHPQQLGRPGATIQRRRVSVGGRQRLKTLVGSDRR
jgi:hypothetical protein